MFRLFFALLILLACLGQAQTSPTTDEVMQAVLREKLSTTNPAVKSYEAEFVAGGLRANFWYAQPHRTALWIIDAQDGTPVMALADGKLAIYDPMASTVLLATNLYGSMTFNSKSSKERLKSGVSFLYGVQSDPTQAVGEIQLPSKIESTNFRAELKPMGQGRYELRGWENRIDSETGRPMVWTCRGLTDWPPREVPYRSLEISGARFFNLTVNSVNQPIAESCFQFPTQAILTSGLPVRQLSTEVTKDLSQIMHLITVNISLRRALSLGDPQKAKEALREICQGLRKADAGRSDRQATEKIVAEISKPTESGRHTFEIQGVSSFAEVTQSLEKIDLEALQARDKKIAAQLRQAFQLEATAP